MGRIKNERVVVRVTSEEKNEIIEQADKIHMTISQYVVALSRQKKIIVVENMPELIKQIIRIGTNVNQIVMVANSNKSVSQAQIDIVNSNLETVQKLLNDLVIKVYNSPEENKVEWHT